MDVLNEAEVSHTFDMNLDCLVATCVHRHGDVSCNIWMTFFVENMHRLGDLHCVVCIFNNVCRSFLSASGRSVFVHTANRT